MWWGYGSRCEGKTGAGQCASSVWSLEVSAQDTDTGILRIQSRPPGIIVRNAFTAGTTNEVKALVIFFVRNFLKYSFINE